MSKSEKDIVRGQLIVLSIMYLQQQDHTFREIVKNLNKDDLVAVAAQDGHETDIECLCEYADLTPAQLKRLRTGVQKAGTP